MPEREGLCKSLNIRRHGLYRQGKSRHRERQHAVQCADTQCKTWNREHTYYEYCHTFAGQHQQKDGQEHVPDGSRDREVHPVVHQQDDTEPKCREQNGIDKHLAENCNAHGIAGCHQQMTGGAVFQLCAERVDHDDDYCQCQYSREEDVGQVVTIVSILVTNLMYIYIHGSDPSHDRILVHAFRAEHLSLDSAVREVYHRQNIFI